MTISSTELAEREVTYSATGLPAGLEISPDGVISGEVSELGTHTVTISTSGDPAESRAVTFDWIVL